MAANRDKRSPHTHTHTHKVLTRYPDVGPAVPRVEGHHPPRALWVESGGPRPPVRGEFRGAVEETLLEDGAPAAARHPPLVLRTAIVTIALDGNRGHLGNQGKEEDKKMRVCLLMKQKENMCVAERMKIFRMKCLKHVS